MEKPTIEQVAWVFDKILEAKGGSYRYMIYDVMGFSHDAYRPLIKGMEIANMMCDCEQSDKLESKSDIREEILKSAPPLIWHGMKKHPVHKLGYYYFGIGDGFKFDKKKVDEADEQTLIDLLKEITAYWINQGIY